MRKSKPKFTPLWTGTQLALPLEQDMVEEIQVVTKRVTRRSFTLPSDPFKVCNDCGNPKKKSEFHSTTGRADGLQGICKECKSKRDHKRYLDNTDHFKIMRWNLAGKRAGIPGRMTLSQWLHLKNEYGNRCYYCGFATNDLSPDHAWPLSWGKPGHPKYAEYGHLPNGTVANCRPACGFCNRAKNDTHPQEFLDWLNRLKGVSNAN